MLAPTYSLTIGNLSSSTDNPVLGPRRIVIERDMDVPADAARLQVMGRASTSLGDDVVIAMGHDGENETVFTGHVVALRPALVGGEIHALGTMNALLNLRISATFEDQTAGSIANDLIARAGLSASTVDEGPLIPRFTVDDRVSAFAHLKELADRLGYEFYADREGTLRFHALGPASSLDASVGAPSIASAVGAAQSGTDGGEGYAVGRHLVYAAAGRGTPAWGTITVGGESPMSGQGDTTAHWLTVNDAGYRGSAGNGSPRLLVIDPVARYKDLADRFAAGRLAVSRRQAHQVCLTVLGRHRIDLGGDITVTDAPDELINGTGYIRAIRHRFGEGTGSVTDMRISFAVD